MSYDTSLVENMVKKNHSRFAITVLLTTVLKGFFFWLTFDFESLSTEFPTAFAIIDYSTYQT